jgi:hypothetical protein
LPVADGTRGYRRGVRAGLSASGCPARRSNSVKFQAK